MDPCDDPDAVGAELAEPVEALIAVLDDVVGPWLERCVVDTAIRLLGECTPELAAQAAAMATEQAPVVMAGIVALLSADVDVQRAGPLALLRTAVRYPTSVLDAAGVPAVARDSFESGAFPEDRYALAPATWSDVDPALHEPGIVWGAWKAATVLGRRRAEGRP